MIPHFHKGALMVVLGLTGCAPAQAPTAVLRDAPSRIISLDYCADQYVLGLVDRERILALSPDATQPISYMRDAAEGIPQVRPLAEDALALQPDLIVRSYGGGPGAARLFERAGVPVVQVGWASDMDGIRQVVRDMGEGLNAIAKADAIIQKMDARLAALPTQTAPTRTLYLTPSGTTTGSGSLIDATMQAAGAQNFETRPGWHTLSLEHLVRDTPELIATAFFDDPRSQLDPWSFIRHPVAQDVLADVPKVTLDRAWVSCGSWSAVEAVEALNGALGSARPAQIEATP